MDLEMQELADGIAFWHTRPQWPRDLHNADYRRLAETNPHGDFTPEWWRPMLRRLHDWIAIRPFSYDEMTSRFLDYAGALGDAWQVAGEPFLEDDISTVQWEQVAALPAVAGKIKPTKTPSPVFTSKFCHFLLPRVFPVVDNEGLGNKWRTYEDYFGYVQREWTSTTPVAKTELVTELTSLIEAEGEQLFAGFPMTNKIVELRLIGRHHSQTTSE
jgi:hypothetical protein